MKILQLCKKFPFPLKDGESIAVNAIAQGLKDQGVRMDLLAMNTTRHFTTVDSEVIRSLPHETIKWVPVNTDLKIIGAIKSLLEGSSYHLKRFQHEEFAQAVKNMIGKAVEPYDFILLESLYLLPYLECIREVTDAKVILRSHNLEWEIWSRLAENHRNPLWKWYLKKLSRKLKDYEVSTINKVDYLLPISPVDRIQYEEMNYNGVLYTLPLGIDLDKYPVIPSVSTSYFDIGFIGSLDWRPNLEGLHWFIKEVWPAVRERFSGKFRLHIAGRNTPPEIRDLNSEDIIIHGEVEDAVKYMQQYDFFIVPLFSGSGMRVKILEAMAMGKIVISSDVGIEGIPASEDKEYIKANTKEEYLTAFDKIFSGGYPNRILGRNARSFIEDNYEIGLISTRLYHLLQSIMDETFHEV